MKVLFTDGDWRLIQADPHGPVTDVQHRCRMSLYGNERVEDCWHPCGYIMCGMCLLLIPDEMKGLRTLTDWNR